MYMITIWVPNVVLHVANDRIVPVENVEGTVGRDIDGRGPEIWIIRRDQILKRLAFKARSVLGDDHAVNALEPNYVAVEKIVLELFREMSAGENACSRTRSGRAMPEFFHPRMLHRHRFDL